MIMINFLFAITTLVQWYILYTLIFTNQAITSHTSQQLNLTSETHESVGFTSNSRSSIRLLQVVEFLQ